MAVSDNFRGNAVTGLFIGIGAALVAPKVLPILATIARPMAKGAIKGGMLLFEKGKESMAEAGELLEDLVAEVKVELAEEQQATMAATVAAAASTTGAKHGATANHAPGGTTEAAAHETHEKKVKAAHAE